MNWSAVEAITAAVCAIAALISGYSTATIRAAMERLRADLSEARAREREEMREWINGSFMRAAVAESKIKSIEFRVEHMEDEIRRALQ
jgi:hypothetical protein